MDKYHYDHRPVRHRRRQVLVVLALSLAVLGLIGSVILRDVRDNSNKQVEGSTHTVIQVGNSTVNNLQVKESTFSMELPADWKEIGRKNDSSENSITWQSTKTHQEGRSLKVFIDTIPTTLPVNRLVPIMVVGESLNVKDISANCATFTKGGTLDVYEAAKLKESPAKFNSVDFICDLPRVNDNEVGTGSTEGNNAFTVTGLNKGPHKYFFLYTDHSGQADYKILDNTLRTFKAK